MNRAKVGALWEEDTMRIFVGLAVAGLLVGCGDKKAPAPAAEPAAAPAEASISAKMPDSPEAKAFAKQLVKTTVKGVHPQGSGGASVTYNTVSFAADGKWQAQSTIEAGDESMDCKESGDWSIDEAESDKIATVVWAVASTNCAGRENGTQTRVKMNLSGDEPQLEFR